MPIPRRNFTAPFTHESSQRGMPQGVYNVETAESKAKSTVEEPKRQMTSAVEDARAGTIDQMATLPGLCDVLCPESAVSNIIYLDALPTSDAAADEKSRRRADYARVTSELVCATIRFAAADDDDRISQLVGDIPKVTLSFFSRARHGGCK